MHTYSYIALALMLGMAFMPNTSWAQTGTDTTTIEESSVTDEIDQEPGEDIAASSSETTDMSLDVVGSDDEGDLTSGEYEELAEGATELTEEELDTLDSLGGDIIAVNDEEETVVLENADGELFTIPLEVVRSTSAAGGRGPLLNPKPGDTIILTDTETEVLDAEVVVETDETGRTTVLLFVVTDEGRSQVRTPASVPVYRNNERSNQAALTGTDMVQVVQDESGEIVAIYASSTDETSSSANAADTEQNEETSAAVWYWVLGLIVLVGIVLYVIRRRRPMV